MTQQLTLFPDLQDKLSIDNLENQYLVIEGEIPINLPNNSFISLTRKPPLKIYALGFQPAKSIPEISRWFFNKYAKEKPNFTILEPFAGSGTTILESIINNNSIYWLDYNPLSCLICDVKTTEFNFEEVNQEIDLLINSIYQTKKVTETIYFKNKDFWFQKEVQFALEMIREAILNRKLSLQNLFWLAFSLTVRKVSDMNDSMILAAKRTHIQDIPKRSRQEVFLIFKNHLNQTIEAIFEWQYYLKNYQGFIQKLPVKNIQEIPNNLSYDAVITSPPYINAIDYIWACKFELHWLNLVKNDQERLNLYSQEIGTERINPKEYEKLGITNHQILDKIIEEIYTGKKYQASGKQNKLRARVVYQYFMDMKEHFSKTFNHLSSGGYYCFTIGDISNICGVKIPVANILIDIACEIGFKKEFCFHLLLKNRRLNLPRNVNWANTIKHDTIVVLQKI